MRHLLLGSIGVLAETSDLQREAFNRAFREAGLDWHWSEPEYARLLTRSGGKRRIEDYARARGETVDAGALHTRKTELFAEILAEGVPLRPGVSATMALVRAQGGRVALVTTTAKANIDAVFRATGLSAERFDLIVDAGAVAEPKPSPHCYFHALEELQLSPGSVVAVEDNPDGFRAAMCAGLDCIAFPGAYHAGTTFRGALGVRATLSLHSNLTAA